MRAEHLEDLQAKMVGALPILFSGRKEIHEEEIISRTAMEVSSSSAWIIEYFHEIRYKKESIKTLEGLKSALSNILMWVSLSAQFMNITLPDVEEVEDLKETWEEELRGCGILSALSLQGSASSLISSYYLEEEISSEESGEMVFDIVSAVAFIADRVDSNLKEIISRV